MGDVGIFIDNSNMWIEGKKSYARKIGLQMDECPQWRIKMGAVVECLVKGRRILKGGGLLCGSTPSPTPELWKNFRQFIRVVTYPRSAHTKKEKCTDMELGTAVTEFACVNSDATVILVTGDCDFLPVLKILNRRGVHVELWAWEKALSQKLRDFEYEHLSIYYLDSIIDAIGFTNSQWNLTLDDIPVENSMVFRDYAGKAEAIAELLSQFSDPFQHFEVDNSDMVIIFNCGLANNELDEIVHRGQSLDAVPFLFWKQARSNPDLSCKLLPEFHNSFGMFDSDGEEDETDGKGKLDQEDCMQWTQVDYGKKEGRTDAIYEICLWGKYCKNFTSGDCRYLHSRKVQEFFHITSREKQLTRFTECKKDACHGTKGSIRCKFWHKNLMEPRLCPTCDTTAVDQHDYNGCDIVLAFRTLKSDAK
jgi:hypothetical protein